MWLQRLFIHLLSSPFSHSGAKILTSNTVELPCATTFHKRPPPINDQIFSVKALQLEPLVNGTPSVSDCDHFLGLMVNDFPLFLTSCKPPLDAFSDLCVCCVHYAT